ncbi:MULTISPECIES: AAA family ATPase [unclassified Streptomyces]|uniref:AAA family ATPase n=1 Tax=unclassified Streptomyces TaxID=2593676 RepID=UPI0033A04BBF
MTRRPTLVAVSGPPGAGKTTLLTRALATALGWPAVSRDEIKEQIAAAGADPADPAVDLRTRDAFFCAIGELVRSGTSLAAEAAFQDRLWRPALEPLADLADIRVVRCAVDPALARVRISRRAAEEPSRAVHADADLLRRIAEGEQPIESWVPIALDVPCLVVDTAHDWEPPLARITEFATHDAASAAGDQSVRTSRARPRTDPGSGR